MALIETDIFGATRDKVDIAIKRCIAYCPPEGLYVAFSGGKDSIVALDIVRRSGVKHDAHMNMTTVDPPEVIHFVKRHYPDVERHRPPMTMWQLIEKNMMPPTRLIRFCCAELKERGGTGRRVITGIRWAESSKRKKRQSFEMCRNDRTKSFVHPIIDWTDKDVWDYIEMRGLYTPSLYREGHKRIGCIMCPMAGREGMRRHAARWPKFAEAYRRAIARAWQRRVYRGLKDSKWASPDEMYRWWIDNPAKEDADQLCFRFDQFEDEGRDKE